MSSLPVCVCNPYAVMNQGSVEKLALTLLEKWNVLWPSASDRSVRSSPICQILILRASQWDKKLITQRHVLLASHCQEGIYSKMHSVHNPHWQETLKFSSPSGHGGGYTVWLISFYFLVNTNSIASIRKLSTRKIPSVTGIFHPMEGHYFHYRIIKKKVIATFSSQFSL